MDIPVARMRFVCDLWLCGTQEIRGYKAKKKILIHLLVTYYIVRVFGYIIFYVGEVTS